MMRFACAMFTPMIAPMLLPACAIALLGWMPASSAAESQPPGVSIESHTRETDYTLGSIAHQHLQVRVPAGFTLDPGSLPQKAQNEAIELRDAHWTLSSKADGNHYDFVLDWQIFVAWASVKNIPLKPLHLVFKNKQQTLNVDVLGDKVLVSTLLPPKMDDAHVKLYADAPLPAWPLQPVLLRMLGFGLLLLLALTYLAWVMGWIQLPQERRMPFRQAWRTMRTFSDQDPNAIKLAMRTLTHAMDQFAGQAVTAENLSSWLQQQPRLAPHAAALQAFYADVQRTFFAGQSPACAVSELRALARQLSQLEVS
ncbi:hypothetical protein [Methylophilus aquaticus]|uniref:MxaA protein n=1 Tax=Methylophilus aquaticus TaxID=1971610 RepID=A0ABT9JVR4_9PROT|nr:hypothetical protein [Methylophilus aquaticus]MDP8568226.1 hypothetical protein [Methylophilus aquaticus]